ncbi:MAG: sigma-70 family RNA polymerase sigma factor [Armatimonadetes bacterium]|nr:sigma-70 family RNA polymerase sigma factor [Armatimonadota bacterium]
MPVLPLSPTLLERLPQREFEGLSRRYRAHLERAALALTGDVDDAEDLVQDTLIRAYRYFRNFEQGTNFRAWVLRILHNTHISRYRHAKRTSEQVAWDDVAEHGEDRMEEGAADPRSEPGFELLARLPDEEVQVALESLPESFRVVVELADLNDYSYAEIGRVLRLPIGTVRSRLFRARQRLRQILAPYALREGFLRPEDLETILLSAA